MEVGLDKLRKIMRKIFLLSLLSTILSIYSVDAKVCIAKIHLGGESKDGSGFDTPWGTVSWGGGCSDGKGMCLEGPIFGGGNHESDKIEILENGKISLHISSGANLAYFAGMISNGKFQLPNNASLPADLVRQFDFLDQELKYFIPKGSYNYTLNSGTAIIELQLEKI